MKHKKLLSTTIAVLIAAAALTAFRHPGFKGGCSDEMRAERFNRITEELNLTEDQQAQLKKMQERRKAERAKHREERSALMDKVQAKLNADNPDPEEILDLVKNTTKDWPNPHIKRLERFTELYKILDDDQKAKALEKMQKRIQRHQKRMKCNHYKMDGFEF